MQQTIETDSEAEETARFKNKERVAKNRHGADIPGTKLQIYFPIDTLKKF